MSDPTEILDQLEIGHIPHPGGDLRSHLGRTYEQLRAWSEPDDVCLAGLTHAAYGTEACRRPCCHWTTDRGCARSSATKPRRSSTRTAPATGPSPTPA